MAVSNNYVCDDCGATYTEEALDDAYYSECTGKDHFCSLWENCICPTCNKGQLEEMGEQQTAQMHCKLRRCFGWSLALTPPFTGIWLFYSWCFMPEHDYYRRKLIDYFSVPRTPTTRSALGDPSATWQTPFGKCVLWENGRISLHTSTDCPMSSFVGDCIDGYYKRRLEQLVAMSIYPNKLTKYDFVEGGFTETLSLFIAKCRDFVKKVKSPRQG